MATGGLTKWFGQKWVDIGRPKKGGGYHKCGRNKAKTGRKKYPKCVPAAKAARMSKSQIRSAVRRKRKVKENKKYDNNRRFLTIIMNRGCLHIIT